MTAPSQKATTEHQRLQQLLLLVLGRPLVAAPLDWAALLELAEVERLASLAWRRSGEVIRRLAPATVAGRWRAHAMSVAFQVETLVGIVAEAVAALGQSGIESVVLKGAPLAQRLYGDATARPLADCDLYVPTAQRTAAAEVLSAHGWTSRIGEPPSEETFERWAGGQRNVIEVHSSIADDPLLWHIAIPVEHEQISLDGVSLPSQAGDYLPASLAAHLAKHETAPLLWIVDFHALWASSDEQSRQAARAAAWRAGLSRHLAWACDLAESLPKAAAGDPSALAILSSLHLATGDMGRVRRLVRLSQTPFDGVRVLVGRIWPPEWRDDWRRAPMYLLQRGSRWLARRFKLVGVRTEPTYPGRALSVDDAQLAGLLEETLGRGLAVWIRPRGTSMEPAIPQSAAVRIEPVFRRGYRENDVVLARLPHGHFVLHRVLRVATDSVQLKGDAMRRRDLPVAPNAIIGVCDRIEIGGLEYSVDERPKDALALLTS
ncbi:MAG: hypothetical protein AUG75_21145, partial [Cyanobacteria bacterium 13_1_20CM_4_61_6]